jgi:hypothetical protein
MYAKQVLWEAVGALAASPASLEKRLESANACLSKLHRIDEDLPEEHREEFRAIMAELPSRGDAVPRHLTDEKSRELANRIVSIYTDILGGLA